jgi:hypothetical protein
MTWTTYSEYLTELAKHKSWKADPRIEEIRKELAKDERFYVYVIRDPRPGKNFCPIYVGKAQGTRATKYVYPSFYLSRSGALPHILAKCKKLGLDYPIEIVGFFVTEEAAFEKELELIAKYGRRNLGTGTLCNLTDGGEGASGWIPTEEWRKRRSAQLIRLHKKYPQWRKLLRAGIIAWFEDKTNMQAHSARMKVEMAKPERLAQIIAEAQKNNNDPKFRALRAKALRKYNAENKDKNIARLLGFNADPAHQANTQDKRRIWIDKPETRAALRDNYNANQAAILKGVADYWEAPKSRAKQAERMRARNLRVSKEYKCTHVHTCKTCGKDFKPGSPHAKFCSELCRGRARDRRVRWQTERHCKECGKAFMPNSPKAMFCSGACKQRDHRRKI